MGVKSNPYINLLLDPLDEALFQCPDLLGPLLLHLLLYQLILLYHLPDLAQLYTSQVTYTYLIFHMIEFPIHLGLILLEAFLHLGHQVEQARHIDFGGLLSEVDLPLH